MIVIPMGPGESHGNGNCEAKLMGIGSGNYY